MMDTTPTRNIIDFKTDYYGALKLIDWFDITRVQSAKILVIGAGAIGNEVLKNLALLGVGYIYIFDRDTIEMSNLSRSILYRATDNDQPKASTAARAVREINKDVNVHWQNGDIRFDLGLGLVRRADVVIGCLDNREARLKINADCYKVGRPWIDAGIGQLNGQVRVFYPGEGACYECSFTKEDYQQVSMPCNLLSSIYSSEGKIPTTPTIASIVAGVQVQEALKLLDIARWQGRTLAGREFIFNGTVGDVSISELPEREDCPAHDEVIEPEQIIELRECSAARTTVAQLLDKAEEHLGAGAVVELNFDLALEMKCRHCRTSTPILRPRGKVFQEELICAQCKREAYMEEPTHILKKGITPQDQMLLNSTLADLGVAPLDILSAYGADGLQLFFELTGDEAEIFHTPSQNI